MGKMIRGKRTKVDPANMVYEIFKQGRFPDDSVEERHFENGRLYGYEKTDKNQYSFSMIRHPSPIGSPRPKGIGMPFFMEIERFFVLDTAKKSITQVGEKLNRTFIDYDQLAEEDVKGTLDWSKTQLEKFPKREDAIKFIEKEAERLNWQGAMEDGIGDLEKLQPDFKFDSDRYLSTVKKLFINEMIKAWDLKQEENT